MKGFFNIRFKKVQNLLRFFRSSSRAVQLVCLIDLCSGSLLQAIEESQPFLLTVSGGVSLGSYEGGFLYYLSEFSKRTKLYSFPVITGSSAGAINSALMAVSACQPVIEDYEESLFWQTWIPLGMNELFQEPSVRPDAVFSQESLRKRVAVVQKLIAKDSKTSCKTLLGVTITRRNPKPMRVTENLSIPSLTELVVVELSRSQEVSSGKYSYKIRNRSIQSLKKNQIAIPFQGDFEHDFHLLAQIVLASAAFPVAFEPMILPYCEGLKLLGEPCTYKKAVSAEFIDGGIYDNQPVRAALTLAKTITSKKWPLILLDPTSLILSPETRFITEWGSKASLSAVFGYYVSTFFDSAQKAAIARLMEEEPAVTSRLVHSLAELPLNSSALEAFLGFFESDFRRSDFLFGMYQARQLLRKRFDFTKIHSLPEHFQSRSWKRFGCISQILDGGSVLGPECEFLKTNEERNLLVLLQVALDRIYAICQSSDEPLVRDGHCLLSKTGQQAPRLISDVPPFRLTENKTAQNLQGYFELLKRYQFQFSDLGLSRDESADALKRVNQELFHFIRILANKQDHPERDLIKIAARPILNHLSDYTPPNNIIYFGIGLSQEFGWSHAILKKTGVPTAFRSQLALRTQGISTLLNRQVLINFTPLVGIEYEALQLSGPFLQYRIGIQLGRQFGNGDQFGHKPCQGNVGDAEGWSCTGWVVNPLVIVTGLDRLRIQFGPAFYPFSTGRLSWQLMLQLGFQFVLD